MIHRHKISSNKILSSVILLIFMVTTVPISLLTLSTASADSSAPVQLKPYEPMMFPDEKGGEPGCAASYYQIAGANLGYPTENYYANTVLPKQAKNNNTAGYEDGTNSTTAVFYIRDGVKSVTTLTAVRPQDYFVNAQGQHVSTYQYTETAPNDGSCSNTYTPVCTNTSKAAATITIPASTSVNINVASYCHQPHGTDSDFSISHKSFATSAENGAAVYPQNTEYSFPSSGPNYQQIMTYNAPTNCYGSKDHVQVFAMNNTYGDISSHSTDINVVSTQPKSGNLPLCSSLKGS